MVDFMKDMSKALEDAYTSYPVYQRLLEHKGVDTLEDFLAIGEDPTSWGNIDIPSTLLKMGASTGAFVGFSNPSLEGGWYLSSATSGDPTAIYLSNSDFHRVKKSYKNAYDKVPDASFGLWFTPDETFQKMKAEEIKIGDKTANPFSIIGTYSANEKIKTPKFLVYFNREKRRPDVNAELLENTIREAKIKGETGIFGGFVLFMYYPVVGLAEKDLDLEGFSTITGGGGYSGKKGPVDIGKRIDKAEFNQILSSIGIKKYIDNYGSTENRTAFSGYFDPTIGDHRYTVPEYVKLIVVNQETSEPVKVGESGIPIIATPYVCEANALVISRQDGDMVKVLSTNSDKTVKEFTNILRLPSAGPGGCGDLPTDWHI